MNQSYYKDDAIVVRDVAGLRPGDLPGRGGHRRDEFSPYGGATNRSNPGYGWRDNDRDGVPNAYDRAPESRRSW